MMRKVLFFSAIVALFAFAAAEPELKSGAWYCVECRLHAVHA